MKNGLSKIIDQQLFKFIDQLKATPQYSQFTSQLESIPEDYGKYVNQGLTYFLSFFPLILLAAMAIYFAMAQSTISDKRELLKQLVETSSLATEVSQYERSLIGRLKISSLNDMKAQINRLASMQGINSGDISVETFNTESIGGITKSKASLKISNLNTPDLMALLRVLAVNEKFKINSLNLKRTTDSISGQISLIHFGRQEG
ncbi:MAG: hypothetical protein CME63_07990 [Halobacteriovoraceae bacterium]|nr:hypothetical protein [Halobacteriovoraceae bacterium]|tara:strand:+ start:96528 stop:97136 length:609 start_codon:yes stop_codon:yes gene_type:complete